MSLNVSLDKYFPKMYTSLKSRRNISRVSLRSFPLRGYFHLLLKCTEMRQYPDWFFITYCSSWFTACVFLCATALMRHNKPRANIHDRTVTGVPTDSPCRSHRIAKTRHRFIGRLQVKIREILISRSDSSLSRNCLIRFDFGLAKIDCAFLCEARLAQTYKIDYTIVLWTTGGKIEGQRYAESNAFSVMSSLESGDVEERRWRARHCERTRELCDDYEMIVACVTAFPSLFSSPTRRLDKESILLYTALFNSYANTPILLRRLHSFYNNAQFTLYTSDWSQE